MTSLSQDPWRPGDPQKVAWFRIDPTLPTASLLPLALATLLLARPPHTNAAPPPTQPNPAPTPALELPQWENSFTVRGGVGYRDNVLYSAINHADAPFLSAGLEAFFLHLPQAQTDFHFFFSGDDLRFLGPAPVDHEQSFLSQAEWKWRPDWGHLRLNFQHLYQNQIFDASVTETNLDSVLARAHDLTVHPTVRLLPHSTWWIDASYRVRREFILEPLDDFWEGNPELRLGRPYGHRSELQLAYQFTHRRYDRRTQIDLDGLPIPGQRLEFHQHRAEFVWRHHWDARRRSRTSLKTGLDANLDNGPGYFDYFRPRLALEHRYRAPTWSTAVSLNLSHYQFPNQALDPGSPASPNRERSEIIGALRLERHLVAQLRAVAAFEHEIYRSNQPLDAYRVTTLSAGLQWEF